MKDLRGMKMLIIEPYEPIREMLVKTFYSFNFRAVISVSTIKEGIEIIVQHGLTLDLIITHWGQTGEGQAVVSALRILPKKIPLLVITGSSETPEEASAVLYKPNISREEVRKALEKIFL